jgi:hypothetical protein
VFLAPPPPHAMWNPGVPSIAYHQKQQQQQHGIDEEESTSNASPSHAWEYLGGGPRKRGSSALGFE